MTHSGPPSPPVTRLAHTTGGRISGAVILCCPVISAARQGCRGSHLADGETEARLFSPGLSSSSHDLSTDLSTASMFKENYLHNKSGIPWREVPFVEWRGPHCSEGWDMGASFTSLSPHLPLLGGGSLGVHPGSLKLSPRDFMNPANSPASSLETLSH